MVAPRPLPAAPDLDQLRRQAKELLRAARAGDAEALARFRILPAFARQSDAALARTALALHDAQSVVAREHGLPSWNALRDRVEEITLDLSAATRAFVEAATDGRHDRAGRLLARHPQLADADLHAALVLGRAAVVASALDARPALAREPGGPRGWEPLLYVCHTALAHGDVADPAGLVAIARHLLALGADPNTRFPWHHHGVRRPVLWGATRVTGLLPLAEVLLAAGADPDDGVTLPLAAGSGDVAALELLRAHGASFDQPWATDGAPTLHAALSWATIADGIEWLLAHGADPDPVFATNGESPLHVAARRWDVAMVERLVQRGADASRPRADGRTPYAVAALHGNQPVAEWLRAHGASDALPPVDALVAAGARGDAMAVRALLDAHATLRDALTADHHGALHRAAERGDVTALALLLDCGLDPNRPDDEIGKTALHTAAMAGQLGAVRLLLARGASPAVRDREFGGQPLVWAAEGSRSQPDPAADHAGVARALLDAGSPVDWAPVEGPAEEVVEILADWTRDRARRVA